MNRLLKVANLLLLTLVLAMAACKPHYYVALTWYPDPDVAATGGAGYYVYRATAANGQVSGYARIGSATQPAYRDTSVSPGTYSYYITAFAGKAESRPSNVVAFTVT
ncbi:MAG: hypothetical protein ABSA41_01900 [Terriglobia bacterium]|jgi:hypothetical protein